MSPATWDEKSRLSNRERPSWASLAASVPVIRSECACGALIEGLGASAHAWGNQHHAAECGKETP